MEEKKEDETIEKLKIAAEVLSSYFKRAPEIKSQASEYEAIKSACQYLVKNLN